MEEKLVINKKTLQFLSSMIIFLVIANIINNIAGKPFWTITRFIYMGFESNISAWYSSLLLAIAGLLSYECSVRARIEKITNHWPFLLFSALLFFMSCDEIAQFHEIIGDLAAKYLGISEKSIGQHSAWVWIGGPIILAIFSAIVVILKKSFALVPKSMFFLGIGFASIILGGIVLEGAINWLNHEELQWVWEIETILEEMLEMIGTILIAYSLILWRDNIKFRKIES